jgi:predicted GNAT superfamily acetyltransferase
VIEYLKIEGKLDAESFEKIAEFYVSLFGKFDVEEFGKRTAEGEDLLTIVALENEKIVGCKLGYKIAPEKFYSWLGGVDENYRNKKIAHELMKRQHSRCIEKGYEIVQTKTKNSFKPMLILNLKSGFDITAVERNSRNELKIVLEKDLTKS